MLRAKRHGGPVPVLAFVCVLVQPPLLRLFAQILEHLSHVWPHRSRALEDRWLKSASLYQRSVVPELPPEVIPLVLFHQSCRESAVHMRWSAAALHPCHRNILQVAEPGWVCYTDVDPSYWC